MKLAARLTNEKGKFLTLAGNEYIDIDITVGNQTLASLTVQKNAGDEYELAVNAQGKTQVFRTFEIKGKRTGDKCYKCTKQAKYITHTDKDGNILPHARFTCEEHHYSD